MRFDDRLLTVLNQPAEDRHDVVVRWRQLVDLVARGGANSTSNAVLDALKAIRDEARRVDEPLRAAAARAVAALPLPFGLLEYFASESLTVGAPVIAAANLDVDQWSALHSEADPETRAFIETLHPEVTRGARLGVVPMPVEAQAATESLSTYVPPLLHQVVERIEERRRLRAGQPTAGAATPSGPSQNPALFRWECGPTGEIAWIDGAPRAAFIGRSITKPIEANGDGIDQEVVRAFNMRAPFRDGLLKVAAAGAASGEWKLSGLPAFDPADGRFAGYRGVALRESRGSRPQPKPAKEALPDVLADPASLRELVHEIKTPLNAIIGFAEIIEGQYLGPADRGYRNRAFEIVRQARLLLTGIDDLDFAAKVHSVAGGRRELVNLATLLDRAAGQLGELGAKSQVDVDIRSTRFDVPVRVEPELLDRLLFRFFGALADLAERGEGLQISVEIERDAAGIAISRPNSLRNMSDTELFGTASEVGHGGFMLRLARGLSRLAGGDLATRRDTLALIFPRA